MLLLRFGTSHLEQSSTDVADGEGHRDRRLISLQQRDGVEEDQVTGDHQHHQHPSRLGVHTCHSHGEKIKMRSRKLKIASLISFPFLINGASCGRL